LARFAQCDYAQIEFVTPNRHCIYQPHTFICQKRSGRKRHWIVKAFISSFHPAASRFKRRAEKDPSDKQVNKSPHMFAKMRAGKRRKRMRKERKHVLKSIVSLLLTVVMLAAAPLSTQAAPAKTIKFKKAEITVSKLSFATSQLDLKKYLNSYSRGKIEDVRWGSGNKNIVVVNKEGIATIKRHGTVTIKAKLEGKIAKLHIVVKNYAPKIAIVNTSSGFASGFASWIRRCCKEDARFYALTTSNFDVRNYDGLIIPGGGDVNPARYGERNTASTGISDAQDALQIAVIKKFVAADKPVFGICRGAQILNVALGGSLYQHVNGHRGVRTPVKISKNSFFNTSGKTQSKKFPHTHHQAVKKLGDGLVVTMKTGKVIEGYQHETKPVFGVQFHPELTSGGAYMFRMYYKECFARRNK